MLIAALLIIGVAWGAVQALGRAPVASYERDQVTARALQKAKDALLAHVAQYAARTNHNFPGRMPCPESLSSIGGVNEGESTGVCSNTVAVVGRLPWKTLGLEPLTDGDGERLWYVLSPNFHPVSFPLNVPPLPNPYLNFDTPAALPFDGGNVVALIIAPGKAMNTLSDPGTPIAPCGKVQQTAARYASPLNPAKFFECGNATGAYANVGQSQWTNDRAIAITQAEWAAAIAGGVADRIQRQVAPVLAGWDQFQQTATGQSWFTTWGISYLPYASTFGDPAGNNYCGAGPGVNEGLVPLALSSPAVCDSRWSASSSVLSGLLSLGPCTRQATYVSCLYLRILGVLLPVTITATANNVGNGYRGTIRASDITFPGGGTVDTMSMSLSAAGTATATLQVSFPLLPLFALAEVRIPYLPDADFLTNSADPSGAFQRTQWFRENRWHYFTYYTVAPAATPASATTCTTAGDPGCVEVRGLDPTTGNYGTKRLVLTLAGPALPNQDRVGSPGVLANYFEEHNASPNDRTYRSDFRIANPAVESPPPTLPYAALNDRVAACPFQYTPQVGAPIVICN